MGYQNYWKDLSATDFEIPQTRVRTFMVSVLGDYTYTFPNGKKLEKKLKDLLEDNVDEKFYLSDKMMKYLTATNDKYKVNENNLVINREIACSKTTREGCTRADTSDYICDDLPDNFSPKADISLRDQLYERVFNDKNVKENDVVFMNYTTRRLTENDIFAENNLAPTMTTRVESDFGVIVGDSLKIRNANATGYLEATDGDGVDISTRMEYHRGTVQKDKTQTLTTMGGENNGVVVLKNNLRIRKLTPKECFRLMGVDDSDYENCAKNQSNASLYHLAGDSIVVNVLCAIFKEML